MTESLGILVAVLLNPPETTSGARTRNAVASAARVLGYNAVEIANLCTVATRSVVELNDLEQGRGWADARDALAKAVRGAKGLLAGWGVSGTTGDTRRAREDQVAWLYREAAAAGIEQVWMLGSEPRHPSRWHQYVSDRYGRTSGGTFEQRLAQVLKPVPITPSTSAVSPVRCPFPPPSEVDLHREACWVFGSHGAKILRRDTDAASRGERRVQPVPP